MAAWKPKEGSSVLYVSIANAAENIHLDGAVLDPSLVAVTDVLATTPGVLFCVKSAEGVYLAANVAFAERAGVAGVDRVVGRTARDLYPSELAERYEAQDREVLATGRMLTNELELIPRGDGSMGWYVTSKSRWVDNQGRALGLVAVSVDLRARLDSVSTHAQLASAVDVARQRFASPLTVDDMATAAGMTTGQLERTARRTLGLSPKQLVMRFRLEEALRRLETTDEPLVEIATACGYYDQSAFSRHFRRVVGYTPVRWRALTRATER